MHDNLYAPVETVVYKAGVYSSEKNGLACSLCTTGWNTNRSSCLPALMHNNLIISNH